MTVSDTTSRQPVTAGQERVTATRAALEVIERLEAAHGPLAFFQSGGCCDGTSPICLLADDLPPGPHDLQLGTLGAAPFYIDADLDARWGQPTFVIDVSPGAAEGFSLEALHGVHFITRTSACGSVPS
jgi:uncharacterized protein